MALPSLLKTWELDINQVQISEVGNELVFHQKILLAVKNLFIGFANNPWTVAGSSNSVAAGMDAVDRWAVFGNLVWDSGASAHGWIVLERVDGVQICWDLNYGNTLSEHCDVYMSAGGNYTGGSTTAKPTATDEANINLGVDPAHWLGNQATVPTGDHRYHVWHSTDGLVTRVVFFKAGTPHTIWRFETFQNPRSGHTIAVGCGIYSQNLANCLTVTLQEDNDQLVTRYGAIDGVIWVTGVGRTSLNLTEMASAAVAEEIDSELWLTEVGYISDTVGLRGPKGQAFDMWWGQYQVASSGDTFPNNAAARDFVQFGCFVFPWTGDATVPLTA
jgi:hypothetical protein